MRTKCFCYVVAVVTGFASNALAQKTAPLVPVFSPTRPAEIIIRFHDAFGSGLASGGMSILSAAEVRAKIGAVDQASCAEGSCLTALAARLGTQHLATAQVKTVGKNYEIKARWFIGKTEAAMIERRCDICTFAEALRSATEAGQELAKKAAQAPAPAPAPEPKPEPAPEPAPEPKPEEPPVVRPETHPIAKTPVAQPEDDGSRTKAWPLWPSLVSLGVGVVGLATGIPLLSLDGDPTNCVGPARPDNRNCADLYDTAAGGWLLTGVGITAVAASGVLFYLHLKKGNREKPSTQVSMLPTHDGFVLGAHGSF